MTASFWVLAGEAIETVTLLGLSLGTAIRGRCWQVLIAAGQVSESTTFLHVLGSVGH